MTNLQSPNSEASSAVADTASLVAASTSAPVSQVRLTLRYAEEIRSMGNCPPNSSLAREAIGFRFAFEDIHHRNNFLPVALIEPERVVGSQPVTKCCAGYSLSMFDSVDNLVGRARKIIKHAPLFLKKVGDHFVEVKIAPSDGICTAVNSIGHFDFFEADSFSARAAVVTHGRLPL